MNLSTVQCRCPSALSSSREKISAGLSEFQQNVPNSCSNSHSFVDGVVRPSAVLLGLQTP